MRSDGGEVKFRKQKTRFFQLSADGSTLRWGWKKHVLLFHVDEMECNDDDLSIKLVLTVDRDLIITFPDRYTCASPLSVCPVRVPLSWRVLQQAPIVYEKPSRNGSGQMLCMLAFHGTAKPAKCKDPQQGAAELHICPAVMPF